jgi:TolB-like protein/Tfp pilus assembly protein PilF
MAMKYYFDGYVLDTDAFELKRHECRVAIEPQVFSLLKLLIENADRMVSKDQIIDEIWDGRPISDASIANRVKLAREAVGDDGKLQSKIRTVHGRGFRFIAEMTISAAPLAARFSSGKATEATSSDDGSAAGLANTRPSIVVLPFQFLGPDDPNALLADAIPYDLIQALSCLRWLMVIARGSAFRFRGSAQDPVAVGQALGVRYLMAGSVEARGSDLVITTELSDTHTGGIIWSEQFVSSRDGVHQVRADIVTKVVSSMEIHIPLNEASQARLSVSENLDSWSNYHLGLQHMYRFTKGDNDAASNHFEQAIAQDPSFARAYAGLSFTNFQTAFLRYGPSRKEALADAHRLAERGVELDPLDPFANFTMGRSLMLHGELDDSVAWLDRAITLNPNYSQGHYSHAFADLLSGQTSASFPHLKTAIMLSPLDPLAYAMQAARSLSYVIDGAYEQAEKAGETAARTPGAHYLIDMIAVIACALNNSRENAEYWATNVRRRRPDANQSLFFASFPFSCTTTRQKIAGALTSCGF